MSYIKQQNSLQFDTEYKQIFKMAIPISLAILIPQANFITNNIFLGHYSTHALATASITGVYYLIFATIGYSLNNGLQILIARRAGQNKPKEIGVLFAQGVFISLLIAAIGIFISYFVTPLILNNALKEKDIAQSAISFIKIRIWGLPFLYIYQMRNALLVGTNNSRYLIIGAVAETVSNILFDYLFIFGHIGMAPMGLNGAAIASVMSEFLGMAVIFLTIHKKGIGKQFDIFNHFKFNKVYAKSILTVAAPLMFQMAISIISWQFFYILIEHHGKQVLAISNVMRNLFGLVGCCTWAFASTTSAMVSNLIGQGKLHVIIPLIKKIVRISFITTLLIVIIINIFPYQFLAIFAQNNEFAKLGVSVIRVVSFAILLMSVSTIWLNAVTGTGNSRITFLIEFITIIFYCLYVYLVVEKFNLGIVYGWMSEWLYWTINFSLAYFYLKSNRWKNKKI